MSKNDTCNLTQAELDIWSQAMRDVKPYDECAQRPQAAPAKNIIASTFAPTPRLIRPQSQNLMPLVAGKFAGVDAATVKKLKRGQLPIEAKIDLHGMTQAQAFVALERALMHALMYRKKLMLVITGKGSVGEGVLRTALPKWLNDDILRPYLLAFDWARREDGGSGAAYLLLKKLVVEHDADDFSGR